MDASQDYRIARHRARIAANVLSVGRMAGSFALLALQPLSPAFFVLYVACGLSDVLDGWIVRRADAVSKLGASLDSAADTLFTVALLVALWPLLDISFGFWCWIALIAATKILALVIGFARFRAYAALHTYANKAMGVVLFALPVLLVFMDAALAAGIVCAAATFAALEELFLVSTCETLDRNVKGCLFGMR